MKQSTELIESISKHPRLYFFTEIEQQQKSNMEPQKSLKCQSNLEKKERSWRYHPTRLQTILQSYSNQNRIAQAKKWTQRSMERN